MNAPPSRSFKVMTGWHVVTCSVLCTALLYEKVCTAADKDPVVKCVLCSWDYYRSSCLVVSRIHVSVVPSSVKSVYLKLNCS